MLSCWWLCLAQRKSRIYCPVCRAVQSCLVLVIPTACTYHRSPKVFWKCHTIVWQLSWLRFPLQPVSPFSILPWLAETYLLLLLMTQNGIFEGPFGVGIVQKHSCVPSRGPSIWDSELQWKRHFLRASLKKKIHRIRIRKLYRKIPAFLAPI